MGRRKSKRSQWDRTDETQQDQNLQTESSTSTPLYTDVVTAQSLGQDLLDDLIKTLEVSLELTKLGYNECDITEAKMEFASFRLCAAVHELFSEMNKRNANNITLTSYFKISMAKFEEQQQLMCLDLKQVELTFSEKICHKKLRVAFNMMMETVDVFRKELFRLVTISLSVPDAGGNADTVYKLQEKVFNGFHRLFMPLFYATDSWEMVYQKTDCPYIILLLLPDEEVPDGYSQSDPWIFMHGPEDFAGHYIQYHLL